jgi:hypothetical protein
MCSSVYFLIFVLLQEVFKIDDYVNESFRNMPKDLQYWKILTRLFGETTKHIKRRLPMTIPPPVKRCSNLRSHEEASHVPLVATMEEIFSSSSSNLMITLLLSGSGSVAPYWEELKTIASNLVTRLDGAEIQVMQYSITSQTECPFTKNSDSLWKSIKGNVPTTKKL